MLRRRAAERPQGALQPPGQRREALPAEHHVGVREAGAGQAEVVQPVVEGRAGDGDRQAVGIGEVRQSEPARRVRLAEHDLALGAVHGPPRPHAPLQSPPHAGAEFGVAPDQFLVHGHRA